jgi:nucleoside-diphosphate-sugar epimerase
MTILITGGSGDLGQTLCPELMALGHTLKIIDVRVPTIKTVQFIEASILDRQALQRAMDNCRMVVHIAAWHGVHEYRGERDVYQFWDLNVTGTFNVFEAAARANIKNIVFISSTSVDEQNGLYGHTKVLGEQIAATYAARHNMNVIILRPRAFIPPWNKAVYEDYIEWARWFWSGAVHINDVSQAVCKSVEKLSSPEVREHPLVKPLTLVIDGAYEYNDEELANWDAEGPGTTFQRHYAQYYNLALENGLYPAEKPHKLDSREAVEAIGYQPQFSLRSLLEELERFGKDGPPPPR